MSGQYKRHRDKVSRKVIDGKITVNQGRVRLGLEPLRGAVARPGPAVVRVGEAGGGCGQSAADGVVAGHAGAERRGGGIQVAEPPREHPAGTGGGLMLTPSEFDRLCEQRALTLKAAQPPTPGHSAAAAANEYAGDVEANADAQRRRSRVQHAADPYLGDDNDCEMGEVVAADLDKRYREAYDTPSGYPAMGTVSPELFRRGLIPAGQSSPGTDYDPPALPAPPPSATVTPGMISRPLVTGGPWSCVSGGSSC